MDIAVDSREIIQLFDISEIPHFIFTNLIKFQFFCFAENKKKSSQNANGGCN